MVARDIYAEFKNVVLSLQSVYHSLIASGPQSLEFSYVASKHINQRSWLC